MYIYSWTATCSLHFLFVNEKKNKHFSSLNFLFPNNDNNKIKIISLDDIDPRPPCCLNNVLLCNKFDTLNIIHHTSRNNPDWKPWGGLLIYHVIMYPWQTKTEIGILKIIECTVNLKSCISDNVTLINNPVIQNAILWLLLLQNIYTARKVSSFYYSTKFVIIVRKQKIKWWEMYFYY